MLFRLLGHQEPSSSENDGGALQQNGADVNNGEETFYIFVYFKILDWIKPEVKHLRRHCLLVTQPNSSDIDRLDRSLLDILTDLLS